MIYSFSRHTLAPHQYKLVRPCHFISCVHILLFQEAVAIGFEHELAVRGTEESYFKQLPASLMKKRDLLTKLLSEAGMTPIVPEGGYFVMADTSPLS